MRILPVLSHSLTDEQKGIEVDIDINKDQGLKINFIVELNNTLETRFYCSSLQSRLQDCRLDGCAEGGLLWIDHLSNGQSASRSCIVPVEARVLHQDGLSGNPLCTCLAVMSVLEDLGLWNIRLLWNQDTECSLSLERVPNNIKPWDEIYQFENYALDQINSDQLSERLVNTTEICPLDGDHKFQICFLTSEADSEAGSDFHACLTWGSDNLNGSPVNAAILKVLTLALCLAVNCQGKATPTPTTPPPPLEERVNQLQDILNGLSTQVMLQQFFLEERTRSDGNSGIKNTRLTRDGTKNFYEPSIYDISYLAMHDHANFDRTIGMGELNPVMNGVEFRTRHNDYKLRMPSTTSGDFHATENIPYPDVPSSVSSKPTVEDQIQEKREYFRAFKDQNTKHRDYRPFFKPVLCYLEAAWTLSTKNLDDPFQSDRHFIDAESWFELMDKVRFTSYTGSKSVLENFAYLPTTIYNVSDGIPQYAQWNYRILCHPIHHNLPTAHMKRQEDLMYRLPNRKTIPQMVLSRAERFRLNTKRFDQTLTSEASIMMHQGSHPKDSGSDSIQLKFAHRTSFLSIKHVGYFPARVEYEMFKR
ncbi:hypothetical protein RRG08_052159, partial [Elysia crispata]